jgi:hypothetical protein
MHAPVLPHIPSFSSGSTRKVRSRSTRSRSALYRIEKWSNTIAPCSGHVGGGRWRSSTRGASDFSSMYSCTRSTLTIYSPGVHR